MELLLAQISLSASWLPALFDGWWPALRALHDTRPWLHALIVIGVILLEGALLALLVEIVLARARRRVLARR